MFNDVASISVELQQGLLEGDVGILPVLMAIVLSLAGAGEPREPQVTLNVDSLSSNPERPVRGTVTARCGAGGSVLDFDMTGLAPKGRYSVWVFLFDERHAAVVPEGAVAAGALGGRGTRHEFVADALGRARLVVLQPSGPLSAFGVVRGCLLDEPQWRVVGGFHPRGVRAGTYMPPPGEIVAQFGITYRKR
jgi:hypothetical protein